MRQRYVPDDAADGRMKLQINAQNCVHCKCCSIKTPQDTFNRWMRVLFFALLESEEFPLSLHVESVWICWVALGRNLEHCRNSSIGRYLREAVALNTLPCEAEACEALEFAGDSLRRFPRSDSQEGTFLICIAIIAELLSASLQHLHEQWTVKWRLWTFWTYLSKRQTQVERAKEPRGLGRLKLT